MPAEAEVPVEAVVPAEAEVVVVQEVVVACVILAKVQCNAVPVCREEIYPEEMYPEEIYPEEMYPEEIYPEEMYPEEIYPERGLPVVSDQLRDREIVRSVDPGNGLVTDQTGQRDQTDRTGQIEGTGKIKGNREEKTGSKSVISVNKTGKTKLEIVVKIFNRNGAIGVKTGRIFMKIMVTGTVTGTVIIMMMMPGGYLVAWLSEQP